MLEVWFVVLLLLLFFISTIYFWIKIYIIDIVDTIEVNKKSKFTKTQWILIWVLSVAFVLLLLYISFKYDIVF